MRRTEAPTKLPHSSERLDQSVVTVSVSGCGKYRTTHTSSKRPPSPPNQTRTHTVRKDHIEQLAERIDPYDDELDPPVVRFTEDRSCAKLYHARVVYSSVERRVVVFHAKADGPTNERSHTRADSRPRCQLTRSTSPRGTRRIDRFDASMPSCRTHSFTRYHTELFACNTSFGRSELSQQESGGFGTVNNSITGSSRY